MREPIRLVRGMHDLHGEKLLRHRHVVHHAREWAHRYGFSEAATPIVEPEELFTRSIGDTTDIVSKEMYRIEGASPTLVLRPENTAAIVRMVIHEKLAQSGSAKLFYQGAMFRHERPQLGRQRQFHQIGVEWLGSHHVLADLEVIALGADVLRALVPDAEWRLDINTLGDRESRTTYRDSLRSYLHPLADRLSEESQSRLARNPLRILDSKHPGDHELLQQAPSLEQYLTPAAEQRFTELLEGLARLGIPVVINRRLVRGLDYYCHTAFEFITESLGAQGTLIGGGRYDGLSALLGGADLPGIGWAGGIERLAMLAGDVAPRAVPAVILPIEPEQFDAALALAHRLRRDGFPAIVEQDGKLSRRLKRGNRENWRAVIIIGASELQTGSCILRDMASGQQIIIDQHEQIERIKLALRESGITPTTGG